MVICDESHYLKNHKTKKTKALTPIEKEKTCFVVNRYTCIE